MIGLGIILAHLFGDYILQNDYLANEKTKRFEPALIHAALYTLAYAGLFVLLGIRDDSASLPGALWALGIIGVTHLFIDRYRLVKPLIWALNQIGPRSGRYSWADAKANGGYSASKPAWMSTWLMIVVDNSIHLAINAAAIYFLVLR